MSLRDEQAERAVIGAVLAGLATRAEVGGLRPEDFTDERVHVWRGVSYLLAQGRAADVLTVSEWLKVEGRLVEVGGPARLMDMDGGHNFISAVGLRQHIAIVKDRSARRRLHAELTRRANMALDLNLKPERIAAEAAQGALAAGGTSEDDEPGDVDLWEINDRWDAWGRMSEEERVRHAPYLPLPWEWMREAGMYGFPENLSIVMGRSGGGKTATLSTCMAYWLRLLPHKGAVIGLEDGTVWLDERWIAKSLNIDYAAVGCSRLTKAQEMAYQDHLEHVGPILNSKLKKYRRAGMTAGQLLAKCRRWVDEGVKWIVVDHGLRVIYEPDGRIREDKVIGNTMDALSNLAQQNKVHVIVAWHLNRKNGDDAMPSLEDLKESGYVDAAARFILGLWKKDTRTLATVVKATKVAPVGLTCELEWHGRSGMFDTSRGRVVDFAAEAQAAREAAKQAKKAVNLFDPRARP